MIVCLLAVIGYQIVKIIVLNNRIDKVEEDIASYEEMNQQNQNNLEYYLSDLYLEGEAYKYHFIYPGEKQGN